MNKAIWHFPIKQLTALVAAPISASLWLYLCLFCHFKAIFNQSKAWFIEFPPFLADY
jgi:hypothetical protein